MHFLRDLPQALSRTSAPTFAGLTLAGNLIMGAGNWIGNSSNNRITFGTTSIVATVNGSTAFTVDSTQNLACAADVSVAAANAFKWTGRSRIFSGADGVVMLQNAAGTDFARLQLGGATSAFPAIKRSGTTVAFRTADDSADASITCSALNTSSNITAGAGTEIRWSGGSSIQGSTSGVISLTNAGLASFSRLILGPGTASWVCFKVNGTTIETKLGDDSAFTAHAADRWQYQNTDKSVRWGAGTPEANVTAGIGTIYLRTDGGAGTTIYIKEAGAGNTGWAAK